MRILLVEPDYKNKYPPLGLMKLSAFHKTRGDFVKFVKGCDKEIILEEWDRVYVGTLFTFFWNKTIKTIKFYKRAIGDHKKIYVGGVLATLMADQVKEETNVNVVEGLVTSPQAIGLRGKTCIDHVIPDYSILDEIDYKYATETAYIGYATRGCPNKCEFCAVRKIEPNFEHYLPLKKQIKGAEEIYGIRKDLLLLDNNVLASDEFEKIIDDIISLGYEKGSTLNRRKRYVDFNQGIDARKFKKKEAKLLAKIALRPLRLAFDSIHLKDTYEKGVRLASEHDIIHLSNYVLYNFTDTPDDFYQRLKINIRLNKELGTKIYSFPMKYIPLGATNRRFIGKNWNRQFIRGVQCILLATHGMVSPNKTFFKAAFGSSQNEFKKIISMPEEYIIYREAHKNNGALDWKTLYRQLSPGQKRTFHAKLYSKRIDKLDVIRESSIRLKNIYRHYIKS